MLLQLLIGSILIVLSIGITSVFIALAIGTLNRFGQWTLTGNRTSKLVVVLSAMTLWVLIAFSLAIWMWAFIFVLLDAFQTFEEAFYFSIVSFTTLGFGDIILPMQWRILSGFLAANGLVLFGLNTAFIIEVMLRIGKAQRNAEK